MNSLFKETFYDWHGLNAEFSQNLHLSVSHYDLVSFFDFCSKYLGNYKYFPLHLLIILSGIFLNIWTKRNSLTKEQLNLKKRQALQTLSVLLCSMATLGAVIMISKKNLAFTRPICTENFSLSSYAQLNKHIFFPDHKLLTECTMSTPSGHSAYITALVVSLWPRLSNSFKYAGVLLILVIMQARISLGMHFIADTMFGALAALIITLSIQKLCATLLRHLKISA